MNVLIISACFPPEPMTSANTTMDIASLLKEQQCNVTVLAPFPNRPTGTLMTGFLRTWRKVRIVNGIQVIHCWHTLSKNSGLLSRFVENFTFGVTSSLQMIWITRPNIVYLNTWPLIAQNINMITLRLLKIRVVTSVQDVYPESLIEKGIINRRSLIARIMMGLDSYFLRRCAKVFTISPGMAKMLTSTRKLDNNNVLYFPNWLDGDVFTDVVNGKNAFRNIHGISEDKFVAMFAGSLTLSAGVQLYVEVAEILKDHPNIILVLVGDGSARAELEREIGDRGLTNIRVIYPFTPQEAPFVQSAADVLMLSLKGTMTHSAAPSKQISYMFSGRTLLAAVPADGHPSKIIKDAGCGVVVPPDTPQAFADALLKLDEDRSRLSEMGRNARIYAMNHFSKKIVLPQLIEVLKRVGNLAANQKGEN